MCFFPCPIFSISFFSSANLVSQGLDDLGVAVSLVDGAVRAEKVKVVLVVYIPDVAALTTRQDHCKQQAQEDGGRRGPVSRSRAKRACVSAGEVAGRVEERGEWQGNENRGRRERKRD